jgi:hypothetical protein
MLALIRTRPCAGIFAGGPLAGTTAVLFALFLLGFDLRAVILVIQFLSPIEQLPAFGIFESLMHHVLGTGIGDANLTGERFGLMGVSAIERHLVAIANLSVFKVFRTVERLI